jgi:hypothetical protein
LTSRTPAVAAYLPAGWPLAQGPIAGVLTYGTDYTAADDSVDSAGKFLRITPLALRLQQRPVVTGGSKISISATS